MKRTLPTLCLAGLAITGLLFASCGGDDDNGQATATSGSTTRTPTKAPASPGLKTTIAINNPTVLPDGLKYEDVVVGTGEKANAGQRVTVHYTGTLTNGTKFDSSRDRGQPYSFVLGAGTVIKGWDEGVAGMKVGGKRVLYIPAALAYGNRSPSPAIPANSDLIFEVELLAIQ